jgi:hypothetical protein
MNAKCRIVAVVDMVRRLAPHQQLKEPYNSKSI